jgi:hypothetical protein
MEFHGTVRRADIMFAPTFGTRKYLTQEGTIYIPLHFNYGIYLEEIWDAEHRARLCR